MLILCLLSAIGLVALRMRVYNGVAHFLYHHSSHKNQNPCIIGTYQHSKLQIFVSLMHLVLLMDSHKWYHFYNIHQTLTMSSHFNDGMQIMLCIVLLLYVLIRHSLKHFYNLRKQCSLEEHTLLVPPYLSSHVNRSWVVGAQGSLHITCMVEKFGVHCRDQP